MASLVDAILANTIDTFRQNKKSNVHVASNYYRHARTRAGALRFFSLRYSHRSLTKQTFKLHVLKISDIELIKKRSESSSLE